MAIYFALSNLFAIIRPSLVIDESIIHALYADDTTLSPSLKIMVLPYGDWCWAVYY